MNTPQPRPGKRLVIDGQILQTSAWYRGMGRYTAQLAHALSATTGSALEIFFVFNNGIDTPADRFEEIKAACPNVQQLHYTLPVPKGGGARSEAYRAALREALQEDVPAENTHYLISSLFTLDFYADFPDGYGKVLLMYDLIPLLFWRDLGNLFPPVFYMARFEVILEAEMTLAISSTTRNDLLKTFGLDPEKVVSIDGGYTDYGECGHKPQTFPIPDKYILFPTGDLPHKNNEIAVKGYAQYCLETEDPASLLITSTFAPESQKKLRAIGGKTVNFTGNVSDAELRWLYANAQAILFASKYEGLGLPVLDAVADQKPVVASRISVFEEMSEEAFLYFDPDDYRGLGKTLLAAGSQNHTQNRQKAYASIMAKYTWHNTAEKALGAMSSTRTKKSRDPEGRIAVVAQYPGIGGQARLAEVLYNELNQHFSIDYYFDRAAIQQSPAERPTFLEYINAHIYEAESFTLETYRKYDMVVYLLGGRAFPSRVAELACVFPGYVLLDETEQTSAPGLHTLYDLALNNHYDVSAQYSIRSAPVYGGKLTKEIREAVSSKRSAPKKQDAIMQENLSSEATLRRLISLVSKGN